MLNVRVYLRLCSDSHCLFVSFLSDESRGATGNASAGATIAINDIEHANAVNNDDDDDDNDNNDDDDDDDEFGSRSSQTPRSSKRSRSRSSTTTTTTAAAAAAATTSTSTSSWSVNAAALSPMSAQSMLSVEGVRASSRKRSRPCKHGMLVLLGYFCLN